ncbi:coiled-coil domain-containing protein 66 isoform 2-T2 [Menidia menidia]
MNLGDGLLFELENGKPRVILLSHGVDKHPAKVSIRSRPANILSSRQPSSVEEVQKEERPPRLLTGRNREARCKAAVPTHSLTTNINTATTDGKSTTLTSSKKHFKDGCVKAGAKAKSNKHKLRADVKAGESQNDGHRGVGNAVFKDAQGSGETGTKDSVICLTNKQLQQILSAVHTPSSTQHSPEDQDAPGSQTEPKSGSPVDQGTETKAEDGEREEIKEGGESDTRSSQEKESRLSGSLFSWLEGRDSDSRAAVDARKAEWRRELDEQVALKQRSAPGKLQASEYAESVLSAQSSVSHREQHAAIRSSLRLGEITPMEELLSTERKEAQRRRWLEELDRQRLEAAERRKEERRLHSQTEDHERWATHFDSLQRRPLLPPPPLCGPERGGWEPSSSLSLWDATSSCGAESLVGASLDSNSGCPTRTSYLRTMTSLLDPVQIEERERRRLKQLEQQRAIEAQMEERRKQKKEEEARRRREEEEEERRLMLEREMLQRQYELEALKKIQKEQPERSQTESSQQETAVSSISGQQGGLEDPSSSISYKDTAVQTEAAAPPTPGAESVQAAELAAQHHLLHHHPPPPPSSRSRAGRAGKEKEKENICVPAGDEPDHPAAVRTERSRGEKRRPDWNTLRPSRRFVPASARYPPALQRNRQERRLRRQAELLALQERTRPPRQVSPPRQVEPGRGGASVSTATSTHRGRSPPVPPVTHRVQSQQDSTTPAPPVLDFFPYVRTDEVFHLDPLEPAHTPPTPDPPAAPPPPRGPAAPPAAPPRDRLLRPERQTQRQQEILRGLAELRQGLLQKQRELETDLNPLLNRHDNKQRSPTATNRT